MLANLQRIYFQHRITSYNVCYTKLLRDNDGADVSRVAFAVDACLETVERAIQAGAGLLFVHHGLFWGRSLALRGRHYRIVTQWPNRMAEYQRRTCEPDGDAYETEMMAPG